MAIAVDQVWPLDHDGATGPATEAGATLIASISCESANNTLTLSDDGGNTYTLIANQEGDRGLANAFLYYCRNASRITQLSVAQTGTESIACSVMSFTGFGVVEDSATAAFPSDETAVSEYPCPVTVTQPGSLVTSIITLDQSNREIGNDATGWVDA